MAQSSLADVRYESTDVPITELRSSENNPRQRFDPEALNELANDIKAHGILEPLIVRPVPNDPGVYQIVAGERRYRAAQQIGLGTVPVRVAVRGLEDVEALELAIAENLRRADLDGMETAKAYQTLTLLAGRSQTEVAAMVGKSAPVISNTMRLLTLPEPVQQRIRNGELSTWHGVQIARFSEWPAVAEQIGTLAVERHTAAKDLESSLPFARDLVKAGLAYDVPADLPFASTLQKDRGAYVKAAPGSAHGYYLNAQRFRDLKAEADTAEKARLDAARKLAVGKPGGEAPAKGKPKANATPPARKLPMLDEMPSDGYIRLDADGAIPEGCTENCPCRGAGLLSDGSTGVPICVDRRRYNRLAKATDKSEEKRLLQQHQVLDQWLEAHVPTLDAFTGNELAVIFGRSIQWLDEPVQRALAQLGLELPDVPVRSDAFLNWLAGLDARVLLQLAFTGALRGELNGDGGLRREMALTRWYLGAIGTGMPEPPAEPEPTGDAPESTENGEETQDDEEGAGEPGDAPEAATVAEDWPPADTSEVETAEPAAV